MRGSLSLYVSLFHASLLLFLLFLSLESYHLKPSFPPRLCGGRHTVTTHGHRHRQTHTRNYIVKGCMNGSPLLPISWYSVGCTLSRVDVSALSTRVEEGEEGFNSLVTCRW